MRLTVKILEIIFAEIILALASTAGVAQACSCIEPAVPCAAVWSADAVFVGRALERQPEMPPEVTRFLVERAVRGVEASEAIDVEDGPGSCAVSFAAGHRYVVYAYHDKASGRFTTNLCTRTHAIDRARTAKADQDFAYFEELQQPVDGTRLTGTIIEPAERPVGDGPFGRPVKGIAVTARAISPPGQTRTATTSTDGRYEIAGLGVGLFEVSANLPPAYESDPASQQVNVADPHACPVANFIARRRED